MINMLKMSFFCTSNTFGKVGSTCNKFQICSNRFRIEKKNTLRIKINETAKSKRTKPDGTFLSIRNDFKLRKNLIRLTNTKRWFWLDVVLMDKLYCIFIEKICFSSLVLLLNSIIVAMEKPNHKRIKIKLYMLVLTPNFELLNKI